MSGIALCHFCAKVLPEEGQTHYSLVDLLDQDEPCCTNCRISHALKMVALVDGTGRVQRAQPKGRRR